MTLELFTSAVLVVTVGTSRLFPRPTRSRCCNRGRVRRRLSAAKAIERFVKRTKSLAHLANKLSMPQEKRDRVRNMVEHGRSLKISTEFSVLTSRKSLTILTAQSCRLPARGGYEPPEIGNNDSLSTICNVRLR